MERGSISKPRRGASGETKPAYTLTLNLHPPQPWGINFCVNHPICGTLLWQPMQMNAVSRLKRDAWCLEPRGEAFSPLVTVLQKFFWGSQRIIRIQYSGASWKKTQKGGKASSSLTVKEFHFQWLWYFGNKRQQKSRIMWLLGSLNNNSSAETNYDPGDT